MNSSEHIEFYAERPFPETPPPVTAIDPNDPPWGSATALAVWFASVVLVVLLPSLILLPYLMSKGGGGLDKETVSRIVLNDPVATLIQVAAIIPVHLITLFIGWLVVTRLNKGPFFNTLGWRTGGMRWHYIAVLVGFFAVAAVVGYFLPEQDNEMLRLIKSSRTALYLVAFLAVFTAPFVEELVYRGVLFSAFRRSVGPAGAIAVVTLLFALVHVPQYYPSVSTIILITLLSLMLTAVRERTGNLLPCVILHTIFNGLQSLLLLFEPNVSAPGPSPVEKVAALIHFIK